MIPVTQTRTGFPAGNCTEATIASILEIPLSEVPDLFDPEEDPVSTTWRQARWIEMHRWLLEKHGLKYVQVCLPPEQALPIFVNGLGEETVRTTYHMLMGKNPDGLGHAVVGLNGEMVWDPNPLRRGIVDPDEVVFLVPVNYLPAECRDWPGVSYTPRKEDQP